LGAIAEAYRKLHHHILVNNQTGKLCVVRNKKKTFSLKLSITEHERARETVGTALHHYADGRKTFKCVQKHWPHLPLVRH